MSFISVNPATGRRLRIHKTDTPKVVAATLRRAHETYLEWRQLSAAARARHLRRLAAKLREQHEELAQLITAEMGKPITQSHAEVEKCAAACDFYAKRGGAWLEDESPPGAPANARVCYEPLGIILAIMPWNFPLWQVFRAAVPALMAGNTVILKHASNVSGCAKAIARVAVTAGLPAGALQALLIGSAQVPAIIQDSRVGGVTLTGSTGAGKAVAALAGTALKPTVFELGGSDPYIVLEDADLDAAADVCASARLINNGQSCIAAKRFIVVAAVRRDFEEKFATQLARRVAGDPRDPACNLGPLAREDLRAELHAQVERSVQAGARLLTGGVIPEGPGFYYPATALTNVRPGMPAYNEELFGPVASIIPVRDEHAAISAANDSIYGLGAAIFTRKLARARAIVPQLQAGVVVVNDYVRSDASLPFGGTKQSGFGRELGAWGLHSFVNVKTVCGA